MLSDVFFFLLMYMIGKPVKYKYTYGSPTLKIKHPVNRLFRVKKIIF